MNDREPTSGDAAPGSGTPSREDVLAALSRILSSADFAQSDRIKRFLAFVVEESLAGRAGLLKEYTIGLEVFDRDDSFDPQTSSIVRVEASRLRAKLEKYNATAGRDDPARIILPAGSYAPTFIAPGTPAGRDEIPASSGGKRRFSSNRVAIVALGAAILGGAGALLLLEFGGFDETADPVTEAAAGVATDSIAVLPLRNLSGEAGEDNFSDGMTDALITRLAMQGSIRVISLTSAMVYKDVNMPIADIARELGVSHVIEGSVLRVGNKVRITAQLIEAESDRHLWAESYERDFADVLALQDDVVGRIAESFSGSVTAQSDGGTRLAARIDPAAQEAYLKGLYFRNKMTADGLFRAGDRLRAGFRPGLCGHRDVLLPARRPRFRDRQTQRRHAGSEARHHDGARPGRRSRGAPCVPRHRPAQIRMGLGGRGGCVQAIARAQSPLRPGTLVL